MLSHSEGGSEAVPIPQPWQVKGNEPVADAAYVPCFGDISNPDVVRIANEFAEGCPKRSCGQAALTMSAYVGTCIPWLYFSITLNFVYTSSMVFGGFATASCTGLDNSATYDFGWVLAGFVPFLICHLLIELTCFSHCCLPYIQVSRVYVVMGQRVSFSSWLAMNLAQSIAYCVSLTTNALFAATTVYAEVHECGSAELRLHAAEIWRTTLQQSYFVWMFSEISFARLVVIAWILTHVCWCFLLFESTPCCGQRCKMRTPLGPNCRKDGTIQKWTGEDVVPAARFLTLAEAAGLATIMGMSPSYAQGRAAEELAKLQALESEYQQAGLYKAELERSEQANATERYAQELTEAEAYRAALRQKKDVHASAYASHVLNLSPRVLARIGLVGCLRTGVQLNVQTSIFAIHRALGHSLGMRSSWQEWISIFAGMATSLPAFSLAYGYHRLSHIAWENLLSLQSQNSEWIRRSLWRRNVYLGILSLSFVACVSLATIKFVMAYQCDHALWNLGGCADISLVLALHPRGGHAGKPL